MTPAELKLRIQFHEEQGNRLLQANPLVAEFFHHITQIELLKQRIAAVEKGAVESVTTDQTPQSNGTLNGISS